MKPRIFNILTLCSAAVFTACAVVLVGAVARPENSMRLTTKGTLTGWSNQQIALEWNSSRLPWSATPVVPIDAVHRYPGVAYAHGSLGGPAGQTDYRLLLIDLWWPMLLTAIAPGLWGMRVFAERRRCGSAVRAGMNGSDDVR